MADPNGRWFSFVVHMETFVVLEKKGVPQHLTSLENLDMPVTLTSLLHDPEELGEAAWPEL